MVACAGPRCRATRPAACRCRSRASRGLAGRWFEAENDFLGDPFSSHVNPVFWHFHGWIDDRIEDWFRAHERVHPGQVRRAEVNGVPWFAPGRW